MNSAGSCTTTLRERTAIFLRNSSDQWRRVPGLRKEYEISDTGNLRFRGKPERVIRMAKVWRNGTLQWRDVDEMRANAFAEEHDATS